MRQLLITGGAGFIGSNFVHYWSSRYPEDKLLILDALTYAGNKSNILKLISAGKIEFVQGSVTDAELVGKLLSKYRIDTIVHFAAESHVDRSISGPEAFIDTNIIGTHTLLALSRAAWLDGDGVTDHLFHHVSTDEVYGTLAASDPAFSEATPYAPNSPYAASKAASDHLVRSYYHTYGLQVTTSNCSNNYGPFHFPEKLIPLCLLNILAGRPLPIYGDGKQIRDWLYVDDHCRGIDLIIKGGRRGETYNIGGNNEWTNIDVIRLLCNIVDKKFSDDPSLGQRFPDAPCSQGDRAEKLISFVADRPGHDTRYAIDASKIGDELGYAPDEQFESGLVRTVTWYLANEPWWRAIQDCSYRSD